MFCKQCGAQIKGTEKFCSGCGARIEQKEASPNTAVCLTCGASLNRGAKFCKQCGTKVTAPPAERKNICAQCGAPLRTSVKFCKQCGAPADADKANFVVSIPVQKGQRVTSVTVSNEPPIPMVVIPTTQPVAEVIVSDKPPVDSACVCPECGAAVKPGRRFCKSCGAALCAGRISAANTAPSKKNKREEKAAELVYGMAAAQTAAGECALPMELNPVIANAGAKAAQSLPALLGGGIKSFFANMLGIFKSTRKLIALLALGALWIALNLLQANGVDSGLIDLLSRVTAAGGSLGTGSISKGFVAALVCSMFGESGFFKRIFGGIRQIFASFGKGKGSFGGTLLGFGAALLFCRLIGDGGIAPAVLSVSGVLLALRSLGGSGYGRKILGAALPKKAPAATSFLAGWALGFGLAMPVSEYALLGGIACVAAGLVLSILFHGRKDTVQA